MMKTKATIRSGFETVTDEARNKGSLRKRKPRSTLVLATSDIRSKKGCNGYLVHPFKIGGLDHPDRSFPSARNSMEDKANLFLSPDGERKTPSGKTNRCLLAGALQNAREMQAKGLLSKKA
jgi:hypothetical protein